VSTEPEVHAGTGKTGIGLALTLLAAISFAVTGFVANEIVDDGTPGVVVGFYEAVFGLVFVIVVKAKSFRRGVRVARVPAFWILLAALGFAGAFGSFYTALSRIEYSVGAPILGAVPLVSYVVVLFVLRGQERITPRAGVGAAFVVVGVGVIGVAS
jgi:drug/metabolite transporter (DMT)-like permease